MKEGWEYKKLGEVADVAAGQGAPQGEANYCSDGIPFVKAGNLEALISGLPEQKIQKVSAEVAKSHRLKLYKAGSVLFAKSGMSCMKGWVYTLKNDCYVVSHLAIITPQNIKHGFLNYYFQFNKPNTLIKDAAYPSISLKDISNMPIPCPPLSEQQQIVEELDLLSSIIEKKKAQLNELDNLAQSLFYEMFGDPITNEKGWELSSLKQMGELGRGVSKHRPRNAPELLGGDMPLIQTGDVSNADMYIRTYNSTYSDIGVAQSKIWKSGTLCITIAATIGKCSILEFDACFPDSVVGFTVNMNVCNNEYVYFIFSRLQSILEENAPAVAQKNINLKVLNNLEIPLPPLDLQIQFAEKVKNIEHQKELIKQSIKEVETLFNSRMDYYFN